MVDGKAGATLSEEALRVVRQQQDATRHAVSEWTGAPVHRFLLPRFAKLKTFIFSQIDEGNRFQPEIRWRRNMAMQNPADPLVFVV